MLLGCQGCGYKLRLIPHGDGRYALPGQPPPPAVPADQRRPPWITDTPPSRGAEAPPPPPSEADPAPEADPEPIRVEVEDPTPPTRSPDESLTAAEALAVLGLKPGASGTELERAFHRRSKTCHPDKVAHLDAEFQELAEQKFRRLKAAFDLLRS